MTAKDYVELIKALCDRDLAIFDIDALLDQMQASGGIADVAKDVIRVIGPGLYRAGYMDGGKAVVELVQDSHRI